MMLTLKEENMSNKKEVKKNKNNKKVVVAIIVAVLVIAAALVAIFALNKKSDEKVISEDAKKFKKEYTQVADDNIFKYKTAEEIIKILDHGTGIVFLGFPECPWCQRYAKYLNEVAKENGASCIYYYNIKEDRKNNTENYQKIVGLLSGNLQYDDEGNERIYVPDVTFVKDGVIVGHDAETSLDTHNLSDPNDYWTDDAVNNLKTRLANYTINVCSKICTYCNAE